MYKKFYGLSEDPFTLNPDPRFLYLAISHWKALSSMMSGIKEKKRLILITGAVGVGKTILIHALLKDLTDKIKTAFVFNPRLDFKNLLQTIFQELDIPLKEKGADVPSLMLQFTQYLQERLARDEIVTLIIDEAQSLDEKVLEEVLRMATLDIPAGKALQVLLVGQPELEEKLDSPRLRPYREKIAIHGQVRPLTREEGRGYIRHRLKLVGQSISEIFTSEAVQRIWEFAGGIPRVVNLVCDRALLIGYTNSNSIIDSQIADQAIGDFKYLGARESKILRPSFSFLRSHYKWLGALALLILCLGVFSFYDRDFDSLLGRGKEKSLPAEEPLAKKPEETQKIKTEALPSKKGPAKKAEEIIEAQKAPPAPLRQPMPKRGEDVLVVKEGWTLSLVAKQYFSATNNSLLDILLEANPEIADMDLIFPGQKIKIPDITEESLLRRGSDNRYHILLGTFVSAEEGRRYKDEPDLRGKKLKVVFRKVSPRETWYRIVAEEFETQEEALSLIRALKGKKLLPLLECLPRKTA
jgi:general secretion pathway protein A